MCQKVWERYYNFSYKGWSETSLFLQPLTSCSQPLTMWTWQYSLPSLQRTSITLKVCRADSKFARSQWGTALLCNNVSHWQGATLEAALGCYLLEEYKKTMMHIGRCYRIIQMFANKKRVTTFIIIVDAGALTHNQQVQIWHVFPQDLSWSWWHCLKRPTKSREVMWLTKGIGCLLFRENLTCPFESRLWDKIAASECLLSRKPHILS